MPYSARARPLASTPSFHTWQSSRVADQDLYIYAVAMLAVVPNGHAAHVNPEVRFILAHTTGVEALTSRLAPLYLAIAGDEAVGKRIGGREAAAPEWRQTGMMVNGVPRR